MHCPPVHLVEPSGLHVPHSLTVCWPGAHSATAKSRKSGKVFIFIQQRFKSKKRCSKIERKPPGLFQQLQSWLKTRRMARYSIKRVKDEEYILSYPHPLPNRSYTLSGRRETRKQILPAMRWFDHEPPAPRRRWRPGARVGRPMNGRDKVQHKTDSRSVAAANRLRVRGLSHYAGPGEVAVSAERNLDEGF